MGGFGSGGHPAGTAALERANAEALSPPETCAVRHGIYLSAGTGAGFLPCDKCAIKDRCPEHRRGEQCAKEIAYTQEHRQALARAVVESGGDLEITSVLIESQLVAELRLGRALRYLSVVGELLPGYESGFAELQPLAKLVPSLQREVRDGLAELNLTPRAQAKLRMAKRSGGREDLLRVLFEAKALEARQGEPVDADFEARDDDREDGDGGED